MKQPVIAIIIVSQLFLLSCPASARTVDRVVAVVNDEMVLFSEVQAQVALVRNEYARRYSGEELDKALLREARNILDGFIDKRLLVQEARHRGIEAALDRRQNLEERIEELKKTFGSEKEFDNYLKDNKLTMNDLRTQEKDTLLAYAITSLKRREIEAKLSVSKDEISKQYAANQGKFELEELVKISQIFMAVTPGMPTDEKERIRATLEEIREEIQTTGSFSELARKFSQEEAGLTGGEVGSFRRGELEITVEQKAFSLKQDDVSDVFESPAGFHIIKVVEKQEHKVLTLEEASPRIEQEIKEQKAREQFQKWLKKLRQDGIVLVRLQFAEV